MEDVRWNLEGKNRTIAAKEWWGGECLQSRSNRRERQTGDVVGSNLLRQDLLVCIHIML